MEKISWKQNVTNEEVFRKISEKKVLEEPEERKKQTGLVRF